VKKILFLLLFIPLVSFGQDSETVIESADFDGYDLLGNYIGKIEKVEKIRNDDNFYLKEVFWRDPKYKTYSDSYSRGYLNSVYENAPVTWRDPKTMRKFVQDYRYINIRDEYFLSNDNYKYFTSYKFEKYDEIDEVYVSYGLRLLKPNNRDFKWNNINNLFYRKNVEITKNKTKIENIYNIAVKLDGQYFKLKSPQLNDFGKYFFTTEVNSGLLINRYNDSISLPLNNSLKKQVKPFIWINVDDVIKLGNDFNHNNIPQTVYDENHIITLNDDFDFSQKITAGKERTFSDDSGDHTYTYTFGLEDPSKYITDFDVENAIEYKISYISNNTKLEKYKSYYVGSPDGFKVKRSSNTFIFEVKKKIKGILYYDNKIFSEDVFGYFSSSKSADTFDVNENYDPQKLLMYKQGEGLLKIFRTSDNIIFSLNNNLIDKTENHLFENNTILMRSYPNNNSRIFRPHKDDSFNSNITNDFIISKTIDSRISVNIDSSIKKPNKTGEWAGNGSGIIISKSGHIITNYHVIEDAESIEVEFILNEVVQKFNAEIVQVDKTNDLAVLKIFDINFDGLYELPYNFKTRSSDVGTKVYAYGYPMALSVMGKEIKITDGIISSKSGYDGDITTYQISAPIQGGNSGGPLFDDKGNFLGINSSGLGADVANNVGYTIKSSYVLNLIDVLPKTIDLPSSTKLQSLPLTEQIKEISKYVVLIKVK